MLRGTGDRPLWLSGEYGVQVAEEVDVGKGEDKELHEAAVAAEEQAEEEDDEGEEEGEEAGFVVWLRSLPYILCDEEMSQEVAGVLTGVRGFPDVSDVPGVGGAGSCEGLGSTEASTAREKLDSSRNARQLLQKSLGTASLQPPPCPRMQARMS